MINHEKDIDIPLKIVVVGHVDDGKSTLIGRLLYETHSLPEGKVEELKAMSLKRNMPMEWSFALDAFQAERDQAITIDTTQILLKTKTRNILLIDAPGHIEFLKNMVSGAADADAALLLVDGSRGIQEQTYRHAYFLSFLGINKVIVIVNKMDLIGFSKSLFDKIFIEVNEYYRELGVVPQFVIPVSARHGDNLITSSKHMAWYKGPSVLNAMSQLTCYGISETSPLRLPVQDIYKFDERRIIVGKIESGSLKVGDEILFSPSHQKAKIRSIETWNAMPSYEAKAGTSVGITLDQQLFVERGDMVSHVHDAPVLTTMFRATLFWFGNDPFEEGKSYKMKFVTREVVVTVEKIESQIDVALLQRRNTSSLEKGQCGEAILRTRDLLPIDEYQKLRHTGRFILIDDGNIVAGGMISMKGFANQCSAYIKKENLNLTMVDHHITSKSRAQRNGHKGGVIWFTGLSGSGKSTLAMKLESILFLKGYQTYVLDGDNIRSGLNSNLGFSPEDRAENVRRIGEVAALFADAGFICISAFISPYQEDRENARLLVPKGSFHEVYINAGLKTCEKRDPKGLYKKARSGEIVEFTGISAPYEEPRHPNLIIDTDALNIDQCVTQILFYIKQHFSIELNLHSEARN